MPRFIVIPREQSDTFASASPEEMQQIVQRYIAWGAGLTEAGTLLTGEKLVDGQGRVLRGQGDAMSATDGPFTEVKEVVGGFWIIQADDLDGAQTALSDCPHLEYGSLEIREIEEYDL